MTETFFSTLNQILMMLGFILIGFFMRKKNIGGDNVSGVLSSLLVNIFAPALCLKTFAENFSVRELTHYRLYLLCGIIVLAFAFIIAAFLANIFGENELQKDVYMYSFLIPNLGYMGYPIMESVFGSEMLLKMMIFALPFNIVIYTYGIYILNPRHEMNLKAVLNPNIIAMLIGMFIGITEIRLPIFMSEMINSAKACMSPSAMLLTGFVLGAIPVRPVLLNKKAYIAALIRGVLISGLYFAVMHFLKLPRDTVIIAAGTLAMPMGLNSIVFPEAFGGDSATGAKICLVSNIISIITIPLVFSFLSNFA